MAIKLAHVMVLAALPFSASGADGRRAVSAPEAGRPACAAAALAAGQPWTLGYSWRGGLGPGSVDLLLSSDGRATLTSTPAGGQPTVRRANLPPEALARIAGVLGKWPLACVHTLPREGYVVFDLGRYELRLTSGQASASAYVDECHDVDEGEAFAAMVEAVQELAPVVGEDLRWGPSATTSARSNACKGR